MNVLCYYNAIIAFLCFSRPAMKHLAINGWVTQLLLVRAHYLSTNLVYRYIFFSWYAELLFCSLEQFVECCHHDSNPLFCFMCLLSIGRHESNS